MKTKWILILSTLLVISCKKTVKEEALPGQKEEALIPIKIATAVTKVTDTAFEKGDAIGLYVTNQPAVLTQDGNHADNVKFTFDGEKWAAEKELYWYDDETPADFYAYYPYAETMDVESFSFSVQPNQSTETGYKASELLSGLAAGIEPTPDPVWINARHLMSCLMVELKAGTGWTEEDVNAAAVSLVNLKTKAILNLKDNSITAGGDSTEITPLSLGSGIFKALVVPQSLSDSELIKIKVGNNEYTFKTSVNLLSGKQHKCPIIINRSSEGINIGVEPWEEGEVYGGTVE